MAVKTTLEQLEEVQAAITKVIAGQAVSIDGISITRASLDKLHEREEILLNRYYREQGTRSPFTRSKPLDT